jgi:hypothetical protein
MQRTRGLTLLARAGAVLDAASIPWALIGAAALAAHGVARATADVDVLVTDVRVLQRKFWAALSREGIEVELRFGDVHDPLAGVVRAHAPGARSIDVIVGRGGWQDAVLARAIAVDLAEARVPVVGAADLVLLKLYAGGPHDLDDVRRLLATEAGRSVHGDVEARLPMLPAVCADLWLRVRSD